MAQRGSHTALCGSQQQSAPWFISCRRGLRAQAVPHQHQQLVKAQQLTTAQVAAFPAFTDDSIPTVGAGNAVASRTPQQAQRAGQPGWPALWKHASQQQQQQQEQLQHAAVATLEQEQEQQQQQSEPPPPGSPADSLLHQLQQCSHWVEVAALVKCHQQELTFEHASVALQQLCSISQTPTLFLRQQQQLEQCIAVLADTALQELPQLGHAQVGKLLAQLQVLKFKPTAGWIRSVLQHAGTELVHYTPAELALLLLTATQTAARLGVAPGPDTPVVQLMPSRRVPQPNSFDALAAAAGSGGSRAPQQQQQQHQQQQQQRRANTVLTSAWLQHFLSMFQPYIACRSAHPQLAPGHMEAVISCLAALRVAPDRFWLYLFVRQMSAQLPQCNPASVVRMLSALATLGYRLPDHVLLQVERQISTASAMAQLRAEECVDVVRSVAVLRAQQSKPSEAWLQQLLAAGLRGNIHLSASAVIGLLAATAALGVQLDPSWMDLLLLQARAALSAMTAHEHVSLIDALSQQQHHRPGPMFMSVYMAQVAAHMPELSLSQQTALATGLAAVGYKPAASWMAAFMVQLLSQPMTGADGDDLLQLLKALRRMQYVPAPNVAQQLSGLIDNVQLSVPYQQLLLLREALDELQYQRGIMAVPGGPRRAAEAAAAAAAVTRTAAASTAGAPGVDAGAVPLAGPVAAAAADTAAPVADSAESAAGGDATGAAAAFWIEDTAVAARTAVLDREGEAAQPQPPTAAAASAVSPGQLQ